MTKPLITVIGSINMDMVTLSKNVPVQGETIMGEGFETYPGGKGANQAVAAARLGGNVQMIGQVGEDSFGIELKRKLEEENICIRGVESTPGTHTGVATIILSNGDNRIIVVPGANNYVTPAYVETHKDKLLSSDLVLIQFEIPLETVCYCLDLCEEHGIPVILNPAPARMLEEHYWRKATYITPNETEAKELFSSLNETEDDLHSKLVITMGEKGATYTDMGSVQRVPAYQVNPIDTTGAGDTFNGALAVALGEKMILSEAIRFANAAAALSVLRYGAQGGMPIRRELENFLGRS